MPSPAWLDWVLAERQRQDTKWGQQDHNDLYWLGILMEEVGELSKAIIEGNNPARNKELVEAMAVCAAWLECIERNADA